MIRVEMSPITFSGTEYSFPIIDDFDNFVYPFSEEKLNYFKSNTEELLEINLDDFVKRLEMTPKGLEPRFNHKSIEKLRNEKTNWGQYAEEFLEVDKETIAFKFTHFEKALLHLKSFDNNQEEYIPYDPIEIIEKENNLVLDKKTIYFLEKKEIGLKKIFEAKIKNIEYDNGAIVKIESYGFWALTNNMKIEIEFNKDPLNVFNRSDNNAVITINSEQNSKWQWSLINGKFMEIVNFK